MTSTTLRRTLGSPNLCSIKLDRKDSLDRFTPISLVCDRVFVAEYYGHTLVFSVSHPKYCNIYPLRNSTSEISVSTDNNQGRPLFADTTGTKY